MNNYSVSTILDCMDFMRQRLRFVRWLFMQTDVSFGSVLLDDEVGNVLDEQIDILVETMDYLQSAVSERLTAPAVVKVKVRKVTR